jgi:predicted glutamine amidotransferase
MSGGPNDVQATFWLLDAPTSLVQLSAGEPTIENTHPFEQHGRLFAHNGVLGDLPALRERLGPHAELVRGSTDSELYFTLITKHIEEHDGDVAAGITGAAREIAAEIPLYSLNMLLATATDIWALRCRRP